jgi:hypothetical protein
MDTTVTLDSLRQDAAHIIDCDLDAARHEYAIAVLKVNLSEAEEKLKLAEACALVEATENGALTGKNAEVRNAQLSALLAEMPSVVSLRQEISSMRLSIAEHEQAAANYRAKARHAARCFEAGICFAWRCSAMQRPSVATHSKG